MGVNSKVIKNVIFGFNGVAAVSEDILHILCVRILGRDFDSYAVLECEPILDLGDCRDFHRLAGYVWYTLNVGDIDVAWLSGNGAPQSLYAIFDTFSEQCGAFCGCVQLYLESKSGGRINVLHYDAKVGSRDTFKVDPIRVPEGTFGDALDLGLDYGAMSVDTGYVDSLLHGFDLSVPLCGADGAISTDVDMICRLCCTRLGKEYTGASYDQGKALLGDVFAGKTVQKKSHIDPNGYNVVDSFLGMWVSSDMKCVIDDVEQIRLFRECDFGYVSNFASWLYFCGKSFMPYKLESASNFVVAFCGDLGGAWCALPVNVASHPNLLDATLSYGDWVPILNGDGVYGLGDLDCKKALLCTGMSGGVTLDLASGCMWSRCEDDLGVLVRGKCEVRGYGIRDFLQLVFGYPMGGGVRVDVSGVGVKPELLVTRSRDFGDTRPISGFFASDDRGRFDLSLDILNNTRISAYTLPCECCVTKAVIKSHPELFDGDRMLCPPVEFITGINVVPNSDGSYFDDDGGDCIDMGWFDSAWEGVYAYLHWHTTWETKTRHYAFKRSEDYEVVAGRAFCLIFDVKCFLAKHAWRYFECGMPKSFN